MDNKKLAQLIYGLIKLMGSMSKDLEALWQAVAVTSTSYSVKQSAFLLAYASLLEELPDEVLEEIEALKAKETKELGACLDENCTVRDETVDSLLRKIIAEEPDNMDGAPDGS